MESNSFSQDLRRYTSLIWRWAWLIVLVTGIAAGSAYFFSKRSTPIYEAVTTILINEAPATSTTDYSAIVASERQAQTYAQLLSKQPVLEGVVERMGLDMDVSDLRESIQVSPLRDTTLIEVSVENSDPLLAALIADAIVTEFSEQIQELQAGRYASSKQSLSSQLEQVDQQIQDSSDRLSALQAADGDPAEITRMEENLAQYRQTYAYLLQSYEQVRLAEAQSTTTVIQAEPAVSTEEPIRPRTFMNTILAGLVGMFLALGVVFLKEAMDDTIKSPDEVQQQLGLPVLGLIARHDTDGGKPVSAQEPRSLVTEAFRSLRTNIQFASVDSPLRTILVTSPSPADGKTLVAVNLAVVMAQSGRDVVLLDADLRRPRVHKTLEISNRKGVTDLFVQENFILDGSLQPTDTDHLSVITSGGTPPNPAELLGSARMTRIFDQLLKESDLIIIDSPPVMAVTDASVLAPRVDGVLLVVKPGVTNITVTRHTVEQLRRVGANILGVVLNEVDLQRSRYNYYYYRGYYQATKKYASEGESEAGKNH